MSDVNREEIKALVQAQAFDTGRACTECGGSGRMTGGLKVVHSVTRSGIGADWALDGVLAAIDEAQSVEWVRVMGHPLAVTGADGRVIYFQVQPRGGAR